MYNTTFWIDYYEGKRIQRRRNIKATFWGVFIGLWGMPWTAGYINYYLPYFYGN